jgi:amino acid transporter
MTALLVAPFAVLSVLALVGPRAPLSALSATATPADVAPDLAGGVLVAMWNTMGWDNASTIAGEVRRPERAYPIAVLAAVALVTLTYVVPVAAMWRAGVDPSAWHTGSWVDSARAYGGTALGAAIAAGAMVGAFGTYSALCLSYSRLPAALADDGFMPRVFARRFARSGTPWFSVLACSLAWTLSLGLSFEHLVSLDILLYGGSLVLEFIALVVLRVREPDLPRPFRVRGGLVAAVALGVGPAGLLGFALVKNIHERVGGVNALALGCGIILVGPIGYAVKNSRGP